MSDFDVSLFYVFNDWAGGDANLTVIAVFLAHWLIFVMVGFVVVSGLIILFSKDAAHAANIRIRHLTLLLRASLASVCGIVDGMLISLFLFRERPFMTLPTVHQLIASPLTAKSFPSDHATIAFAVAVSVLFMNRRWGVVALLCALAVSVGRVMVGVHYPSDVLVGALLGSAWAAAVAVLARKLGDERWMQQHLKQDKAI